ncbi:hypothetical protein LJR045_002396 [Microbacterium sp. LjRoot45]|uniref:hypothetical protein n=1 Tax=Microbacterium sp. LjRoot45 TaxID=3342329 RepID=UPI003ECCBDBA
MTLITFAVTPEYVVMASDRRLTTSAGRRIIDQSDRATKTTLLWGQMLMGYTGVAILDGKPMEMWAAEVISGVDPAAAPQALADAMNEHYASNRHLRGAPHQFQLAGFAHSPNRTPSSWPVGVRVGNCEWGVQGEMIQFIQPVGDFQVRYSSMGNHKLIVGAIGAPYPKVAMAHLRRTVKFAVRANPSDPGRIFEALVNFTRLVASSSRGTVGEVVTVSSLPRSIVPSQELGWTVPLGDQPPSKTAQFSHTFYPNDQSSAWNGCRRS